MTPPLGDDWRFCPLCGATLAAAMRDGRPRPACARCGFVFFAAMGVGVAAVINDSTSRVALVQRAAGLFGAGLWCLPCGYVEWGEDVRHAAAREALEETSLTVEIGEVVQIAVNRHDPARPTVGLWFAARRLDPAHEPRAGDDAVAVGWFEPAAPPPLAFPTDARLLADMAARRHSLAGG